MSACNDLRYFVARTNELLAENRRLTAEVARLTADTAAAERSHFDDAAKILRRLTDRELQLLDAQNEIDRLTADTEARNADAAIVKAAKNVASCTRWAMDPNWRSALTELFDAVAAGVAVQVVEPRAVTLSASDQEAIADALLGQQPAGGA